MGNSTSSLSTRESLASQSDEDRKLQQRGFLQLRSIHDISVASKHIPNVEKFVSDLQEAVDAIRSNPNGSRYREVHVLLLSWKDDNLGVKAEIDELRNVFSNLYQFEIHQYDIQGEKPGRDTQARVTSFLQEHDSVDNLLVLYYAGHAIPSRQGSEAPIWSATDRGGSQTVSAGGIQALFEEADSDALLLYDSCHSAHPAVTISGHGVTEVIAASGFEAQAPGAGRTSFTHALIRALTESYAGPPFSVAKLHEMVLRSLKSTTRDHLRDERGEIWTDCNGRPVLQRYPTSTPVHCFLTEERPHRGIILTSLPLKLLAPRENTHPVTSSGGPSADASTSNSSFTPKSTSTMNIGLESSDKTKVLLSIRVEKDYFKDEMSANLSTWREWLRNIPPEAKGVKVEAIYDSFSTLVLLTLPITLWDVLPDNLAYSFVGFVTSDNQVPVLDQMDAWAEEKELMLESFRDFEVVDSEMSDNLTPVFSPDTSRAPSMSSVSSWMGQAFSSSRGGAQMDAIRELRNELRELRREHAQCKNPGKRLESQLSAKTKQLKEQVREVMRLNSELREQKSENERLVYQLKLATTGGYKEMCEKLSQTALEREEVIRGLEEKMEDGKVEIRGLKRQLFKPNLGHRSTQNHVPFSRIAVLNQMANREENIGTKKEMKKEQEIIRKKIMERDECFDMG